MSYETWPATVNTKGIQPYTQKPKSSVIVEENDVGIPNVRNRSTGVNWMHQFKLRFTHTEWGLLKAWVQYNLANGVLPFNFPHPLTGVSTVMRFALEEMNNSWFNNLEWTYDSVTIEVVLEEV